MSPASGDGATGEPGDRRGHGAAGDVERRHWADRRWIRVLRGRGGRPLGIIVLIGLTAAVLAPEFSPIREVRLATFDAYQTVAPRVRISAPAVVVAIDDTSLTRHGQWPWPRTLLARLLAGIAASEPAAIGLDILMPEPDRLSPNRWPELVPDLENELVDRLRRAPSNDTLLAKTLTQLPAIIAVAGLDYTDGATASTGGWLPMRVYGENPAPYLRRFKSSMRSVDAIDRAAVGHGLVNADPEHGIVRRMPLVFTVGDTPAPGLAVEMLRVAGRVPVISLHATGNGLDAVGVGDLKIPTQRNGTIWVHYTRHDPTRFILATDVLSGAVSPEELRKKLVIVGVTALGLSDYQATPVGDRMAGSEIHAQILENIFDGQMLVRPTWGKSAEAGALVLLGTLVILMVPQLRVRYSFMLFGVSVVLFWTAGFWLYWRSQLLVDVVSPTIALGALFSVMLSVTLAEVDMHRRALRRQLQRERETAARLAGELEAARRIQMGILPKPMDLPGHGQRFDLYAVLEPARVVGGDLYDFFLSDRDHLFLLLGDVAGKGLPGSLFMAVSKSLYRSTALRLVRDVASIMGEANREIARENPESLFVTMFAAIVDLRTGTLEYCNAGHELPYVLGGRAGLTQLPSVGGPPLCVMDDFVYEAGTYQMTPGEILCLMTDGVVEANDAQRQLYGRTRLEAVLAKVPAGATPDAVGETLRADLGRFVGAAEPADDVALLVLRWNGAQPDAARVASTGSPRRLTE